MENGDKRTVHTDALATLGTVIDHTAGRDAIHLAVEPVVAGTKLWPGQHVTMINGVAQPTDYGLGIVDPFLKGPVFEGQRFWLVVYPRTITSLRHVWSHPAFDEPIAMAIKEPADERKAAIKWLIRFADGLGLTYQEIMNAAANKLESDEYLVQGGRFEGMSTPDEFWDHYKKVMGPINMSKAGNFFSCSC